jgi:Ca2+/Na+ antiporter
MQTSLEYFKKVLQVKRLLSYMFEDLVRSRYILLLSLAVSLVILVIYMFLLRYLARWMIWLSLILCIVVFALAASFCFTARARMNKHPNNHSRNNTFLDLAEMNITFDVNQPNSDQSATTISTDGQNPRDSAVNKFDTAMILLDEFAPMSVVWLVLGIVCCTICGILMICTCCLGERIYLAAGKSRHFELAFDQMMFETALIEEASKAICHASTTLLWPVVTFVLNIGFMMLGILVLAHYSTLVTRSGTSLIGKSFID